MNFKVLGKTLLSSLKGFASDRLFQMAAALSYYTLLSLAPLFLVITRMVSLMLDDNNSRELVIKQMETLVGTTGADLLRSLSSTVPSTHENITSMSIGIVLTLVGATTVFANLQRVLNHIWHVEPAGKNAVFSYLRARLIALAVVLGLGFLLLVSFVLSAAISGVTHYLGGGIFGLGLLLHTADLLFSIAFITTLLALLFRFVPDAKIHWSDAWSGAFITALLFTLGKHLIGLYLGRENVGSAYGAAGSVVAFMVWVYYASLILFLGAELTKAIGSSRGRTLEPKAHARQSG